MPQIVTLVIFLFFSTISLNFLPCITSISNGFTLKLIHRDSPLSPLYQPNLSEFQRFTKNAEISKTRASHFQHMIQTTNSKRTTPTASLMLPLKYTEPSYTVEVGLGTPVVKRTLIFDTGSGLTWTQCKPCLKCFKQTEPLFNSKTSRSYKPMSKDNKLAKSFVCTFLGCIYHIVYYTGQFSVGFASVENFTFPTSNGVPRTVPEIVFGCGATSRGPFGPSNAVSGILGMNKEPVSFTRQLGSLIKERFSYCLTDNNSKPSYLKFGDEAMLRGRIIQRTPFLRSEHYKLRLRDISIGGRRLGLTQGTFPDGCIIDSGASVSLLNRRAFGAVKNAFMSYFSRFKDVRIVEDRKIAGEFLCYNFPRGFSNFPNMTFHFQGADFDVPPENVFMFEGKMFCVEIVGSRSTTILGAYQQRNVRVVYDLRNEMLSFAKEDCSKDAA